VERGVEPRFREWDPACGITPLEWVVNENLHRRQLKSGQRTALAVELEPRLVAAARERHRQGSSLGGQLAGKGRPIGLLSMDSSPDEPHYKRSSAHLAGTQFGVGSASVSRLKAVHAKEPEMFERVKRGELTVTKAMKLVGLPSHQSPPAANTKVRLADVLLPLRKYLKNWTPERLYSLGPPEAERLLRQVQEVDTGLFEVERALEELSVTSRALR